MKTPTSLEAAGDQPAPALALVLRERDQLILLHEALVDVERARTVEERLQILVEAIRRVGYGRVDTVIDYVMPANAQVVAWISKSAVLDSDELIVPVRSVDGATVATLVLGEPAERRPPNITRVRTVELFAQHVASIIENARLYEESQRERERGEALAERYRRASEDERRAREAVAQSESRYRNLFESATDAIYTLDVHGSFTSVNEATCQMSGRNRDDLLGRSPFVLVAPGDMITLQDAFREALVGIPRRYECRFVRPDGSQRLASVTNTPIRHGANIIGLLGVARDVTDERERARALERSETRYTRLVESAVDGIFTLDADGLLTAVNQSLEHASGRPRATLLGTAFAALVDPRDEVVATEAVRAATRGEHRRMELRYVGVDGDARHSSLTLTPLAEGGALGVVRDVTDEKRFAEQLMQQEKLAAVGQLVSGVAHELNNPLASVTAFAQLLLESDAAEPFDRHAIEAIDQEARRAAKIVSNLLTFARQHQPERRVADLNRVVEDTLELRRYALRNARVDVETSYDLELPLTWADPFQLQQVVLNLVTNAEHALASWPGPRRIQVGTACIGDRLVIRVADTGPGVAPEHMHRIFNPFFTTKPIGEGTGLGLSISDGIVREHHGRIRVESQPGEGATFFVELPYALPPVHSTLPETVARKTPTSSRRILFVDDEAALRQAVTTYFQSLGHVVDAVGTGQDAVACASTTSYDAVMLDLRLPDLTGDEVLARLRDVSCEPRRVVFVTGDTQSESARRMLEATGHPTLSKPFILDDLAALVLADEAAKALS